MTNSNNDQNLALYFNMYLRIHNYLALYFKALVMCTCVQELNSYLTWSYFKILVTCTWILST